MIKFKPFLGRLVVKTINEDKEFEEWYKEYVLKKSGVSIDSKIVIPVGETDMDGTFKLKAKRYDVRKGYIVDMAEDAFGEAFKNKYGSDIKVTPKVGDIIYYIPGQAYKVGFDLDIICIADEDIMGYEKVSCDIKEKEDMTNVR